MKPREILRAVCNNWRNSYDFVIKLYNVLGGALVKKYRGKMLAFCYGLTLLTLGDLGFDLASGVFALLLSLNAYLSYSIIKSKPTLFAQAEAEPLTNFIHRVCKSFNFEQIEQSRHKFCFDCMRIHHNKEDDKIAHCPSKSCNGCIRHLQKHSGLYGVCIGQHNVGLYYLNCILTFVLSIFWLRQSIWSMKPFFTTDYSFNIVFWMSATFALWERSKTGSVIQLFGFKVCFMLF